VISLRTSVPGGWNSVYVACCHVLPPPVSAFSPPRPPEHTCWRCRLFLPAPLFLVLPLPPRSMFRLQALSLIQTCLSLLGRFLPCQALPLPSRRPFPQAMPYAFHPFPPWLPLLSLLSSCHWDLGSLSRNIYPSKPPPMSLDFLPFSVLRKSSNATLVFRPDT